MKMTTDDRTVDIIYVSFSKVFDKAFHGRLAQNIVTWDSQRGAKLDTKLALSQEAVCNGGGVLF